MGKAWSQSSARRHWTRRRRTNPSTPQRRRQSLAITWSALLNIADDKCNRLLKFGDDRTAKQGQRDAAYAVLAAALAAKRDAGIRGGDGGVIRLDEDAQEHGAAREGTRRRA